MISEKIRGTKKTSIAGDAIKLSTSKVITLVISFATVMLLSRFLTLEEYGTYSQILLVTNLFTSLIMLGLPNSINYFLAQAETDEERQKFLSVYYTFSTILSFIVGLTLVCATPLIINYFNNHLLKNFIYIFAIFPWVKIIMSGIENVLIVYKRVSVLMIYRVANSLFLLLLIFFVQMYNLGFQVYMLLFILIESAFAISVYFIIRKQTRKLLISFDIPLIKKVLAFSIPIGLASAVGTINIQLDKLMIGKFFSTEQLAIYTNASRELPLTIVATSLVAVLLPEIVRLLKKGENTNAIKLWADTTLLSYIIISFFVTVFFVYSYDLMVFLYSDKFLEGVSVFRVYCLVLLLKCTYFGMILNAIGKTKIIFYSSIASLIINVILNNLLYLYFGFIGPAIATFISMTVIMLFQLITTSIIIKVSFKDILPWKKLFLITVINLCLGALFSIIKSSTALDLIFGSMIESVLLGILWSGVYFILMYKSLNKLWWKLKGGES